MTAEAKYPTPLVFYRSKACIRITPDINKAVFRIEAAAATDAGIPQKGQPKYDWDGKIAFNASPEEALQLAEFAERVLLGEIGKLEFYHDPGKVGYEGDPKTLVISGIEQEGKYKPFLSLSRNSQKISVPLGRGDVFALARLIPEAVVRMWNWI